MGDEEAKDGVLDRAGEHLADKAEEVLRAAHGHAPGAVRGRNERGHKCEPRKAVVGTHSRGGRGGHREGHRRRYRPCKRTGAGGECEGRSETQRLGRGEHRVGSSLIPRGHRVEEQEQRRCCGQGHLWRQAEHGGLRGEEPSEELLVVRHGQAHEQGADEHAALDVGGRRGSGDEARAADARRPEESESIQAHSLVRAGLVPQPCGAEVIAQHKERQADRVHRRDGRPSKVAVPPLVCRGHLAASRCACWPRESHCHLRPVAHHHRGGEEEHERVREGGARGVGGHRARLGPDEGGEARDVEGL
mmetsp:Transcript_26902/g.72541  ORF Transcript_26902/g.72541 Transcript_26902/m.72541 type:complete len:304 (+) Transcript_26902:399-1310(+)